MAVFVLDKRKKPLMPCSEKRARLLLSKGRAVVHKRYPFTIRLKDRVGGEIQHCQLKLDPGSKVTGMALAVECKRVLKIKSLFHLEHRGYKISEALTQRRSFRRRRRSKLWYRPARFNNRKKPKGWLAPSIQHRVDSTFAWVNRLSKLCPIGEISLERVKFDTQLINNPDIKGVEYQQGTLFGYEVREYILYKHKHTCVYCGGKSGDSILEVEHIIPKVKGGSNRIENLTLSCHSCNQAKGKKSLEQWKSELGKSALDKARKLGIERVQNGKTPVQKDMAAVNATRNAMLFGLLNQGWIVGTGTGAKTKYNRKKYDIPKDHCLDAVCVGDLTLPPTEWQKPVLVIKCMGRGSYKRTRLNKHGFPRGYLMRKKQVFGFQTGDMVKAIIPKGKKAGTYTGRVSVRRTGSFNIQAPQALIQGVSHRHCVLLQKADGYGYGLTKIATNMEKRELAA